MPKMAANGVAERTLPTNSLAITIPSNLAECDKGQDSQSTTPYMLAITKSSMDRVQEENCKVRFFSINSESAKISGMVGSIRFIFMYKI
ncbi:hypothetical protein RHGRI_014458 [Rhododendron griersonianum]|uniref:Uncharacterized protein n=1 Tax=Rhododendron griersonianum TaxID=479676 RepID=A0AAV6K9C9_9ERIC|nr:hypothetical protein RHGRI_014458 [Rhododendron griersonianum]